MSGQFRGKDKKAIVALDAICNDELQIRYANFGVPGLLKNENVLDISKTLRKTYESEFRLLFLYEVNKEKHKLPRYLACETYFSWLIFLEIMW